MNSRAKVPLDSHTKVPSKSYLANLWSERWIRAIMRVKGDSSARAVSQCQNNDSYFVIVCPKGCEGSRKVYHNGCNRDQCPECSQKNVVRRKINVYNKLSRVDDYQYHIVFTVPDALRAFVLRYPDWASKIGRIAVNALKSTVGGKIGGFYSPHIFSSSEPWIKVPHIHLMMTRKVIRDGRLDQVNWLDQDQLKKSYSYFFYEEFGFPIDGVPVINIEIVSNQKAKSHTIPYIVRNPIDFKEIHPFMLTDQQMDDVVDNYVDTHRVNWFGYLANSQWRKFFKVRGLDTDLKMVAKYGYCEKCGEPMILETSSIAGVCKMHTDTWVELKDGGSK